MVREWSQGAEHHQAMERVNRVSLAGRSESLPDRLQGPSLELDDEQVERSLRVVEASLGALARAFPSARLTVVYVPSPLAIYPLLSKQVSIQRYHGGRELHDARIVVPRSDLIFARIADIVARQQVDLVDARGAIRRTAERGFVHGPVDWGHFNRAGYEALAEAILSHWSARGG
jgi:hypothetical protein